VSVWFSLGIRADPCGSAWTGKARTQVKLSSTPCSESAWIHTDSVSFRVIPRGSARNTWGRVKTSFLPCPKCRMEIPESLVCGPGGSRMPGYQRVHIRVCIPFDSLSLLSYLQFSCGWFEWLSLCSSAYASTRASPPGEFPIDTVEPRIALDLSL
jgi:hypothetical protein